jgi:hypothetical protein
VCAEVHPWIVETAAWCAALVGITAGLVVAYKALRRPVRYVWGRLVAEPAAGWFDALLSNHTHSIRSDVKALDRRVENVEIRVWEVQQQFRKNGGSSAKDQWDRVEQAVTPTEEDQE